MREVYKRVDEDIKIFEYLFTRKKLNFIKIEQKSDKNQNKI